MYQEPNQTPVLSHLKTIIVSILKILFPLFSHCDSGALIASPIHPTGTLAQLPPMAHSAHPRLRSPLILVANVLTPKCENGKFPYRKIVEARISVSGNEPLGFDSFLLGPVLSNEPRLAGALRLSCHAVCRSCANQPMPARQQCNPSAFYLNPVRNLRRNQDFFLDQSRRTLTVNVKFEIKHRPKVPKLVDLEWRCPLESLM